MAIVLQKVASRREQILGLLVLLALFIMFYRLLLAPKQEMTKQLKDQMETQAMEEEALIKFTEALKQKQVAIELDTATTRLSTKMEILNGKREAVAKEAGEILNHITQPQFLRGIAIKEMSDLAPTLKAGVAIEGFSIEAEGPFDHITKYLERIEKIPALVTIDKIRLKSVTPKASKVRMALDGSLYSISELGELVEN